MFIEGLLGAGLGLLGNIFTNSTNRSIAKENLEYQRQANQANMELTREAWQRDDTAVQRRVADLQAAGLSKTLVAGNAAGNTSPIHVSSLHNDYSPKELRIAEALQMSQAFALGDAQVNNLNADSLVKAESADNLSITNDKLNAETGKAYLSMLSDMYSLYNSGQVNPSIVVRTFDSWAHRLGLMIPKENLSIKDLFSHYSGEIMRLYGPGKFRDSSFSFDSASFGMPFNAPKIVESKVYEERKAKNILRDIGKSRSKALGDMFKATRRNL